MNSYMWSDERFIYQAKQPTVNVTENEDKFQQILKRLNHFEISSARSQNPNQPLLTNSNVGHDVKALIWKATMKSIMQE